MVGVAAFLAWPFLSRRLLLLDRVGMQTRITVEAFEQRFIGLVIQMMDLVSPGQQVCHGGWRRFVRDGGGNDVGHVSPIALGRDLELGIGEETANSGEMYVAAENGNAD